MRDPNDEAREKLGRLIGNGIEYRRYCEDELAGDFACDTVKIIDSITERAEKEEARVKKLEENLETSARYVDFLLDTFYPMSTAPDSFTEFESNMLNDFMHEEMDDE